LARIYHAIAAARAMSGTANSVSQSGPVLLATRSDNRLTVRRGSDIKLAIDRAYADGLTHVHFEQGTFTSTEYIAYANNTARGLLVISGVPGGTTLVGNFSFTGNFNLVFKNIAIQGSQFDQHAVALTATVDFGWAVTESAATFDNVDISAIGDIKHGISISGADAGATVTMTGTNRIRTSGAVGSSRLISINAAFQVMTLVASGNLELASTALGTYGIYASGMARIDTRGAVVTMTDASLSLLFLLEGSQIALGEHRYRSVIVGGIGGAALLVGGNDPGNTTLSTAYADELLMVGLHSNNGVSSTVTGDLQASNFSLRVAKLSVLQGGATIAVDGITDPDPTTSGDMDVGYLN
jgi:hypothetical protein